ncbi:MAG: glycosyltransferase [Candidatus Ventricola sp.]
MILSIHATQDQKELAAIYSAADLFVNPTREENYPTVNMESIACGAPVLTFKTGGSPEIVFSKTGRVVPTDDMEGLVHEILQIKQMNPFSRADLADAALDFGEELRLGQYVQIYERLS